MPNTPEKQGKNDENQQLTLRVKLLRFTVISERFILATVGCLSSYRSLLSSPPQAYVFPTAKNLQEGAEYEVNGYLRTHEVHGIRFYVKRFSKIGASSDRSWLYSASGSDGAKQEPPPFEVNESTSQPLLAGPASPPTSKYPDLLTALLHGDIPTIGQATAQRLYAAFGDSLFEFTDGEPLLCMTGFGKRRAFTTISNLRTYMNAINS